MGEALNLGRGWRGFDWADFRVLCHKQDCGATVLLGMRQVFKHVILLGGHSESFYVVYVTFFTVRGNSWWAGWRLGGDCWKRRLVAGGWRPIAGNDGVHSGDVRILRGRPAVPPRARCAINGRHVRDVP